MRHVMLIVRLALHANYTSILCKMINPNNFLLCSTLKNNLEMKIK